MLYKVILPGGEIQEMEYDPIGQMMSIAQGATVIGPDHWDALVSSHAEDEGVADEATAADIIAAKFGTTVTDSLKTALTGKVIKIAPIEGPEGGATICR